MLGVTHEGSVPGSRAEKDGDGARADRDRGAPLCDPFARRGRGPDRSRVGFARLTVSGDWDCERESVAMKGIPADPLIFLPGPRRTIPPVHTYRRPLLTLRPASELHRRGYFLQ